MSAHEVAQSVPDAFTVPFERLRPEVRAAMLRYTINNLKRMRPHDERDDEGRCFVYFIGGDEGPIKIGSTIRPKKRLATIQTGSFRQLRYLAIGEARPSLERDLHKRLAKWRLEGEWFERSPAVMRELRAFKRVIVESPRFVRGVFQ